MSRKCFWKQFLSPDSITLQAMQVREIGLQLEGSLYDPFLQIGTMIADFQIVGTLKDDIDKLKNHREWKGNDR